jgi:hypothetical protein
MKDKLVHALLFAALPVCEGESIETQKGSSRRNRT